MAIPATPQDIISFNEGKDAIIAGGLTSNLQFALSSRPVGQQLAGEHQATDTYALGFGEVTYWTGGGRITITGRPASSNGIIIIPTQTWNTGVQTNGPAIVKSVVLIDSNNKLISAVNILYTGIPYPMNAANKPLVAGIRWFLQNVGGGF